MSLVIESKTQPIPAGGAIYVGGGNFLMIVAAGAAITVALSRGGRQETFTNFLGGLKIGRVSPWDSLTITGTPASSVEFIHGYQEVTEDYTEYSRTVGVFQSQQPTTVADAADVNVGASAVAIQLATANAARRRVTFKLNAGATVAIRVGSQASVAAGRGIQLGAEQAISLEPTSAVFAIREAVGTAVVSIIEENY